MEPVYTPYIPYNSQGPVLQNPFMKVRETGMVPSTLNPKGIKLAIWGLEGFGAEDPPLKPQKAPRDCSLRALGCISC